MKRWARVKGDIDYAGIASQVYPPPMPPG